MYCRNCGSQISDEAAICIHCGVPTHNKTTAPKRESNVMALIGFILSFFVSVAGLVCSIIAYRRCKENPDLEGKGMALAGLIISAMKVGAVIVYLACMLILFGIIFNAPGGM